MTELKIVHHRIDEWGVAYAPHGDGPFPAVMVLHGSEGAWAGWSHVASMMLAAHGFLARPFGYGQQGNAWNAGDIVAVPLDRTVDALAELRRNPLCNGRVGLYGASRGGEHVLLLASLMARDGVEGLPDAVAAHAPADVVCGAFRGASMRDSGDPGWRVWDPGERAWTWRGSSEQLLPTTPVEIERYPGPLFLSHGTHDNLWSADMTRRLEARLRANGRTPEVHLYEGQKHGFDSPGLNEHYRRLLSFFGQHLS